jgi:hypothetical protein
VGLDEEQAVTEPSVSKQGYLVQITDEQLADIRPFRVYSEEEIAEAREKMKAEAAAKLVRLRARLSRADPALKPIIDHHRPKDRWLLLGEWSCKGCDAGAYAEDSPEWPCSTIELILEGVPQCECHNDPYNCPEGQAHTQAIHDRKTAQGDG